MFVSSLLIWAICILIFSASTGRKRDVVAAAAAATATAGAGAAAAEAPGNFLTKTQTFQRRFALVGPFRANFGIEMKFCRVSKVGFRLRRHQLRFLASPPPLSNWERRCFAAAATLKGEREGKVGGRERVLTACQASEILGYVVLSANIHNSLRAEISFISIQLSAKVSICESLLAR